MLTLAVLAGQASVVLVGEASAQQWVPAAKVKTAVYSSDRDQTTVEPASSVGWVAADAPQRPAAQLVQYTAPAEVAPVTPPTSLGVSAMPLGPSDAPVPDFKTLAGRQRRAMDRPCPDSSDLKSISEISYDISPEPGRFPKECPLSSDQYVQRDWGPTKYAWTASALSHKPAYFEDVQLERYGHSWGPIAQPIISGAKFYVSVPFLPYKMGVYSPNECIYSLGYYRPGSCSPHMIEPIPLSLRGAAYQAGAIVGASYLIP